MNREEGRHLLWLARNALHLFVEGEEQYIPDVTTLPPAFLQPASTFVTLSHGERLRGCIGSTHARLPLYQDVVRNTIAATRDPRFEAVGADELAKMRIEISLLGSFKERRYVNCKDLLDRLRPGVDGVIVTWQEHRGLLLPQVWERFPRPQQFMQALCHKANIPWNSLDLSPPQVGVATFEVVCFVDPDDAADDLKSTAIGRGRA